MTKAQRAERQEAIEKLRDWIKPGDTVHTILDSVSRSGMSRVIRVVLLKCDENGRAIDMHPNHAIGKALDMRHAKRNGHEQDGLVIGGCGMDMGFHLVNSLSTVLYGGYGRFECPACHHVRERTSTREEQLTDWPSCDKCGQPMTIGGYKCLGKGKCPSNYHNNHRDTIQCEGTTVWNNDGPNTGNRCRVPSPWYRETIPDDWPRGAEIDLGDGASIPGPLLHCITYDAGEIPVGTQNLIMREDGSALQICPTCKGAGSLPNPEGPERFDLIHTDGYALRHRWL